MRIRQSLTLHWITPTYSFLLQFLQYYTFHEYISTSNYYYSNTLHKFREDEFKNCMSQTQSVKCFLSLSLVLGYTESPRQHELDLHIYQRCSRSNQDLLNLLYLIIFISWITDLDYFFPLKQACFWITQGHGMEHMSPLDFRRFSSLLVWMKQATYGKEARLAAAY